MFYKIKALLLQNISTRQTIAKNAFWLVISNVGGRLLRATIIIYAARILGASDWGTFSYALSIAAFLTVFADLGISPVLVREAAKLKERPADRKVILSTAFVLKMVLVALSVLAIVLIAPLFAADNAVKIILPIVALIFAFDAIREFGSSIIRALEKMEWETGIYLFTNAAIVIAGFIFLAANPTVAYFAWAYALGTGAGMIASIYKLRGYFAGIVSGFSFKEALKILSWGWPFTISAILGAFTIDTDILIIGWFRSSEEVGLYAAAQRIVQLLYILPTILAISVLPVFSRLAQKDNVKFKRGIENSLWLVYMAAIPLAFGGIILGKEIVGLIFGGEYLGAATPFQILMLTVLVNFPAAILTSAIFTYNKQSRLVIYAATGGLLNVVLDIAIIPQYGIVGSAFVTLVAQLAATSYLWFVVWQILQPSILPRLKNILPAAILMSVLTFALNMAGIHVLVTISASVVFYFGALLLLREPILEEIRAILSVKNPAAEK